MTNGLPSQPRADGSRSPPSLTAQPSAVELDEPLLPDEYPIYAGYLYVADGKVVRSDWHGITARQFRGREGYAEVRRCDIYGRAARSKAEGK